MSNRPRYRLTPEDGRKGGEVTAAQRRASKAPWSGSLLDLMAKTALWSRLGWRSFAKAISGLGHTMTPDELSLYRRHTRREQPPAAPADEAVMMVGTSGGKTHFPALRAVHAAISFDASTTADGELVTIPIIAKDRSQARMALSYVRGFCKLSDVAPYVFRGELKDVVEFRTGVNIEITTASFRGVRGYTNPCAVLDEVAYWRDDAESSANPDSAIVDAIRTRLSRVPGSQLLILSSPHAPRGVLHDLHEAYFGREPDSERDRVVFWNASTLAMRPDHPKPHAIERAFRLDPVSASSEYGIDGFVSFRQHQQALFDEAPIRSAIVVGRRELPPIPGVKYYGFLDMSEGGRSGDSAALAIAHEAKGRAVLDVVVEIQPPFSPGKVIVSDFAPALRRYAIREVRGDNHARGWVESALEGEGFKFTPSALTKSALFLELLQMVNTGLCELLDDARLRTQLLGLQRFSVRSGHDSVDHPRGGHDDAANAAAGALTHVVGVGVQKRQRVIFGTDGFLSIGADEKADQWEEMRRLARATIAQLEAQDELDWRRAKESEDMPLLSEPVWHVHRSLGE